MHAHLAPRFASHIPLIAFCLVIAGCTSPIKKLEPSNNTVKWTEWPSVLQQQLIEFAPPSILLLGEQHNAPEHALWARQTVETLQKSDRVAALVMEMADAGFNTRQLPSDATDIQVQTALQWNNMGWPWERYGPIVMAAVQSGVPVFGGNLARSSMSAVMQENRWDQHLPTAQWEAQRTAIRTGHCDLLPDSQITPMARIQLAKDESMARTALAHLQPNKTVLLLAGKGHVWRNIGIPTWLPQGVSSKVAVAQAKSHATPVPSEYEWLVQTPALPDTDHCQALRERWKQRTSNGK